MEELQGADSSGHRLLKTEGEGFDRANKSINQAPIFEG